MKFFFTFKDVLNVLLLFVVACGQQQPVSTSANKDIVDSLTEQSIDSVFNEPMPVKDSFYEAVKDFSNKFAEYKPSSINFIDTLERHSDHWLFKAIERSRERLTNEGTPRSTQKLKKLPSSKDYDAIQEIRQGLFHISHKGNNDVTFEQWTLKNTLSAEQWLVLLRDSLRGNIYTKPPRFQWVEGKNIYIVGTRSAGPWFEFSDTLTMQLSGKTKNQLHTLYNPLDLKYFKKWQGPAHSSVSNDQPHLFTTEKGSHYSYFYFFKQRSTQAAQSNSNSEFPSKRDFQIVTSLLKPFTGDERFESIEETLVEIQCGINDPSLNNLNLVNKEIDELQTLLGPVLYEKGLNKIYGHANRIIVIKAVGKKVERFKYLRLNDSFSSLMSNDSILNKYILTFSD